MNRLKHLQVKIVEHVPPVLKQSIFVAFFLLSLSVLSQNKTEKPTIAKLIASVDTFRNNVPSEKIYIHLDKPYYVAGDTVWFKLYVFEANFFAASEKSGICYLEIADEKNILKKRMMLPVVGGISWGNISLEDLNISVGNYIIRVYTSLMRNYGEQLICQRPFHVYSSTENVVTPTITTRPDDSANKDILAQSINGKMNQNIDLQFMPEGGTLVGGIFSILGFKAIDENGKGIQIVGKILDSKQQEITTFSSYHLGMGSIKFSPQSGETYTARISVPDKIENSYPLPVVQNTGTVLSVLNPLSTDSLEVALNASSEISALGNSYFLIGHSRGVVCFAKEIHFKNGPLIYKLSKNIFPSGITCFTLLDNMHQPINERIIYIDHHDDLKIEVSTDRTSYTPKDSVSLQISVSDKDGMPVQGSFSLSVTDDAQVIYKPNNISYIASYLFLVSELKGHVENPAYYYRAAADTLQSVHADSVSAALDHLLLTQGWVAYPWNRVFNYQKPEFEAEPEFMIKGKASNILKGIPHSRVLLYSKSPLLMLNTLTDENGRFVFKNLNLRDSASFIVQSINKSGGSFFNNITVDEFKPPIFSTYTFQSDSPGIKSDTTVLRSAQKIDYTKNVQRVGLNGNHLLGEVLVSGTRIVKSSKSLNGSGNADQVLNTSDLEGLGKMTLLDLLKKKVKGFAVKRMYYYYINDSPIKLVIDGNYVDTYDSVFADEYYNPNRDNLEFFLAEDILGMEVMSSPQFNMAYNQKFLSSEELQKTGGASANDYVWIEITTRAGRGAMTKRSTGVLLYKPMPFSLPKQFYRPKYSAKDKNDVIPDFRSTIHWEPSIVTDANGKATVSFYTADMPTKYTVFVEGSDMLGNVGSSFKAGFIDVGKK